MLANIVLTALQVCEGTEYHVEGSCKSCGGTLSGYDTRAKRFAILCDDEDDHAVKVFLHRSYCLTCGRIWLPEEPFYKGTRVGSPVVDLCRAFSTAMPCGQVARRLGQMGITVDRWSVRSYCRMPYASPPTIAAFGMNIPISVITLSALTGMRSGGGHVHGEDILAACNYPSRRCPQP
jgi:hypothetical protein